MRREVKNVVRRRKRRWKKANRSATYIAEESEEVCHLYIEKKTEESEEVCHLYIELL
jgi:hypothetical protein